MSAEIAQGEIMAVEAGKKIALVTSEDHSMQVSELSNPILPHVETIGIVCLGGMGLNFARDFLKRGWQEDKKHVKVFVADTDASSLHEYFEVNPCSAQKDWVSAGALTIHQLGGKSVTNGRGTGAMPAVGKKAAETPESMQSITMFVESVDLLIILAAAGGGSGAGAMQVVAKIANEKGKTTIAVPIMPKGVKGARTKSATEVLAVMEKLAPVNVRENEELLNWAKTFLGEEVFKKLTRQQVWSLLNDKLLIRFIESMILTMTRSGDTQNLDHSDVDRTLAKKSPDIAEARHAFFSEVSISMSDIESATPESIRDRLVVDNLQKSSIVPNGHSFLMSWFGPWPAWITDETESLIYDRLAEADPAKDIMPFSGTLEKVEGDTLIVTLLVVARNLGDGSSKKRSGSSFVHPVSLSTSATHLRTKQSTLVSSGGSDQLGIEALEVAHNAEDESSVESEEVPPQVAAKKPDTRKGSDGIISFKCGTKERLFDLGVLLALEYYELIDDPDTPKEALEKMFDEVQQKTNNRPPMPMRYTWVGKIAARFAPRPKK